MRAMDLRMGVGGLVGRGVIGGTPVPVCLLCGERGLARGSEGRVGRVVMGVVCLIGAGPAGWLR